LLLFLVWHSLLAVTACGLRRHALVDQAAPAKPGDGTSSGTW